MYERGGGTWLKNLNFKKNLKIKLKYEFDIFHVLPSLLAIISKCHHLIIIFFAKFFVNSMIDFLRSSYKNNNNTEKSH